MIVVQDRVEHESVAADGFAAIDRIVREQQNVAFPEVGVNNDGPFGNRISALCKSAVSWSCCT